MQDKFELLDKLPIELQFVTAQKLSSRDLINLVQTSKYHFTLFQPMLDVRKLLHHVVRCQHDAVQLIVTDDISFMFQRGKVTDCSGREFENISSFEYALWALDKHMWTTMIACIPCNEEGKKVFAQLIAQYNKVNSDGVTYRLNGKMITEKHFDFENTIIKELQTLVNSSNTPEDKNCDAFDKQWREGVGGAQTLLPMHVVSEYCSNEPFTPVPSFTLRPKSSKKYYCWMSNKNQDWFDSVLGILFAINKGHLSECWPTQWLDDVSTIQEDLVAMMALYEVRTLDLINLKSQLEERVSINNYYQVAPM